MTKAKSTPKDSGTTTTENAAGSVNHSLLNKSGPDDLLLKSYRKVEKKLGGVLKNHISNAIEYDLKLEVSESLRLSYKDWSSDQEGDSVYLEFQLGVADNPVLVRVARTFLTASVDCFFGGQFDGATKGDRELRKSEIAMIGRLADAIAQGLAEAWSMLFETTVRYNRCIYDKDELELSSGEGSVLISATAVEISGHQIPAIDVIQTLDGLVAIESQLNRPHLRDANAVDPVWQANLQNSMEQIYLPVRSVLARPTMHLSELAELAVGDILAVAPTDNVPLIVGDRVFAHGSIGEQNGGVAFKINNFL